MFFFRFKSTVHGIDISAYQHPNGASIDFARVKASGTKFVFVKATEGTSYVNSFFHSDWTSIGSHGMYRGAYHFAQPGAFSTAGAQARHFVATIGSLKGSLDLPPVLDLEVSVKEMRESVNEPIFFVFRNFQSNNIFLRARYPTACRRRH
jgi:GH25 family lysozyme M1 (1,4-beta-N-acetylmuramidase)